MLSVMAESLVGSPANFGLTIASLLVVYITYLVLTDPLRDIPGPFVARYNPFYLAIQSRLLRRSFVVHQLHAKYGDVVRVGLNSVSVISPGSLQTIYGVRKGTKSAYYDVIRHDVEVLFSTRDANFHGVRRKALAGALTTSAVADYETSLDIEIQEWKDALKRQTADGPKTLEFKLWSVLLTFSVISDFIFGKSFGWSKSGGEGVGNIITSLETRMRTLNALGNLPPFLRPFFLSVVGRYIDPFWGFAGGASLDLKALAEAALVEREAQQEESGSKRKDMMGYLTSSSSGSLPRASLIAEASSFVSGGSDSSAVALTHIIDFVSRDQVVAQRLRQELNTAFPDPVSADWVPTSAQLEKLPYLNAVLYESLRLRPSNAAGLPRNPTKPIVVANASGKQFVIPPSAVVSVATYSLHRREDIFGPDPDAFKPERWLEGDLDRESMHAHFNSFSSGDRGCLGRKFVWQELSKALAVLFKEFEVVRANEEPTELTDGFFLKGSECQCVISRRK